jgi:branched-chain amino acid transport system substrate-binding protein
MDKPASSYETGYGVKFDANMQNTLAVPNVAQWQGGKIVTVFPTEAKQDGVTIVDLARK